MTQFIDLIAELYSAIGETGATQQFPITTAKTYINSTIKEICIGAVFDPIKRVLVEKGRLPFAERVKNLFLSKQTLATTAISAGDNSISVADATVFPSGTNYYIINNEIVKANTIDTVNNTVSGFNGTGMIPIQGDFPASTIITVGYDISDLSELGEVIVNGMNKLKFVSPNKIFTNTNGELRTGAYQYLGNYTNNTKQYVYTIRVASDGTRLLDVIGCDDTLPFSITGIAKVTDLLLDADECIIPEPFAMSVVPFLAGANLLSARDMNDRAQSLYAYGIGKLESMYSFYNRQSQSISDEPIRTGKDSTFLKI